MFQIDREKYIRILKSEGLNTALTTLHRDTERWEVETFEGQAGWQPKMWDQLEGVREFSRELWEMGLATAGI